MTSSLSAGALAGLIGLNSGINFAGSVAGSYNSKQLDMQQLF